MTRYRVKLSAVGETTVEVEASNDEEAVSAAYRLVPGMIVEGGECSWEVEGVEIAEASQ